MRLLARVLLILALLVGCSPVPDRPERPRPAAGDRLPPPAATISLTEAVRTVLPSSPEIEDAYPAAGAATAYPAYPAEEAAPPPTEDYPAPGIEGLAASAAGSEPFQDCERTPGLSGCGGPAEPLAGCLAVSDRAGGRLIVLDLHSGSGWQAEMPSPGELAWSPGGVKLLVSHSNEGSQPYEVWSAEGEQLSSPAPDGPARWNPDGSLSAEDTVVSERGDRSRLERSEAGRWTLFVKTAGGDEVSLALSPQQPDQIFVLRDWIPGQEALLVQQALASGAALQMGSELAVVDAQTGQVQDWDIAAPSAGGPNMAWNPSQPGLLAVLSARGGGAPGERAPSRLALLDFNTGQRRDPLPEGLDLGGLAWRPDGQRLAIAVQAVGSLVPPAAAETFEGPGIYLLDPQTGDVERATQPPPGALDGWPQWTADGQLLFARLASGGSAGQSADVIAHRMDTGSEAVLFQGLPAEASPTEEVDWPAILAFGQCSAER